ncbi:ankyrin repeat domain-containing protein [Eleftheria terrae]|uniref:ankyrin repeat domain-containing protein n=1 Tax=Eleftheria terrae TaxID=1597781 RepID=UPI00263A7C8A|nr:ankyrin repeat domain-containing protein [Eleftheria terrae]WKB55370.1 ankyrin repeat domain-containing protein [Eleftheria terrae]
MNSPAPPARARPAPPARPFLHRRQLRLLPGLCQAAAATAGLVLLAPPATQLATEPGFLTVLARMAFTLALLVGLLVALHDSYQAARQGQGPRSNPLWWAHLTVLALLCALAWQVGERSSAAEGAARAEREQRKEREQGLQAVRDTLSGDDPADTQAALAGLPPAVRRDDQAMAELARMAGPLHPEQLKLVMLATLPEGRTADFFESLMQQAGEAGEVSLLSWLLEQGRASGSRFAEPAALGAALQGATRAHSVEALQWALGQGAPAAGRGLLSLCIHSEEGRADPQAPAQVLDLLLKAGADPNEQEDRYRLPTPLVTAARMRDHDAMRRLLRAGADARLRGTHWPVTPLQESVERGDPEGVRLLLRAGAEAAAVVEPDTTEPRADAGTVHALARERAAAARPAERNARTRVAALVEQALAPASH